MLSALLETLRGRALSAPPFRWGCTFAGLPQRQQRLVLRMPLLLGLAWGALRLYSFRTVVRALERLSGEPPSGEVLSPQEVTWAVDAVARRLLSRKPCLPMALVALYLLRRRGHPAVLRLGVKRQADETVGAHAWVEDEDGRVLIGGLRDLSSYAPLPRFTD